MPTMTVRNLPDEVHRRRRPEAPRSAAAAEAEVSPIGQADAQIAAIARTHGFAVATRHIAPFRRAGIAVIDPWAPA